MTTLDPEAFAKECRKALDVLEADVAPVCTSADAENYERIVMCSLRASSRLTVENVLTGFKAYRESGGDPVFRDDQAAEYIIRNILEQPE